MIQNNIITQVVCLHPACGVPQRHIGEPNILTIHKFDELWPYVMHRAHFDKIVVSTIELACVK